MKSTLFIVAFLASSLASSLSSSAFAIECEDLSRIGAAIERVESPEHQLAFKNHGGVGNGGVCWWHSRFTRAAASLAVYRPDLPSPSAPEARRIIARLIKRNQIVEIPGYRNLREFSASWEPLIQRALEGWQRRDGALNQAWTRGLFASRPEVPALVLKARMDEFYHRVVVQKRLTFVMLQYQGIAAHAWLLTDLIPMARGYVLKLVDSNFPGEVKTLNYEMGQRFFVTSRGLRYAPVIGFERDLARIERTIEGGCHR